MQELNKVDHSKCIERIEFSKNNPPTALRKLQGDLFYLNVRTLEGQDLSITASQKGFFKNQGSEH